MKRVPYQHYEDESLWKEYKCIVIWALGLIAVSGIILLSMVKQAKAEEVQLKASWYSNASLIKEGTWKNGKEQKMANGKRFDENALTCANRLYALGTRLKVTNIDTGASVIVITTDRIGTRFATSRIDLSKAAFEKIGRLKDGIIKVKVEVLK